MSNDYGLDSSPSRKTRRLVSRFTRRSGKDDSSNANLTGRPNLPGPRLPPRGEGAEAGTAANHVARTAAGSSRILVRRSRNRHLRANNRPEAVA